MAPRCWRCLITMCRESTSTAVEAGKTEDGGDRALTDEGSDHGTSRSASASSGRSSTTKETDIFPGRDCSELLWRSSSSKSTSTPPIISRANNAIKDGAVGDSWRHFVFPNTRVELTGSKKYRKQTHNRELTDAASWRPRSQMFGRGWRSTKVGRRLRKDVDGVDCFEATCGDHVAARR